MRRRGFTLLELIVASLLVALLMAAVWTLLSTYEALFTTGEAKVEESQLVRTLLEQLADDLHSAVPDSATGMPGASSSVRRFGLFGTEQGLQVDVLQITLAQCLATARPGEEPTGLAVGGPQVPELHTVQYRFVSAEEAGLDPFALEGLVRREIDWETPPAGQGQGSDGGGPSSAASEEGIAIDSSSDPMSILPLDADPEDASILWAPEVIDLRFWYYDGTSWASQWNSLERKSLPMAIEVTVTVKTAESQPRRAAAPPSDDPLEEMYAEMGWETEPPGRTHRFLVHLPGTALARPAMASEDDFWAMFDESAVPEPSPPPLPAIPTVAPPPAPAATTPSPDQEKSLEELLRDQWMRSGR